METIDSLFGNKLVHRQQVSIYSFKNLFWIYLSCSKTTGTKVVFYLQIKEKLRGFVICLTSPLKGMEGPSKLLTSPG